MKLSEETKKSIRKHRRCLRIEKEKRYIINDYNDYNGLDTHHLRWCYNDDFRNHRVRCDFKNYVISFFRNHDGCNKEIAEKLYYYYF